MSEQVSMLKLAHAYMCVCVRVCADESYNTGCVYILLTHKSSMYTYYSKL